MIWGPTEPGRGSRAAAPRPEAVSAGAAEPATDPCRTTGMASPQDWVPRRGASRDASGGQRPRRRPLLAVNHLLNPVVDGDRRLLLRLVVVVAQAGGDQCRRRLSPGSLSVSRTRSRQDHDERDSRQAPGDAGRLSCRACASIRCPPSWAMSSRPRPDPRSACRSCRASTGTLTRCLPAGQENVLQALLCTTMWSLCAKRRRACAHIGEMLGIVLPGRARNRALTWESAIRALCMEKEPGLSTRHAAIAPK